MGFYGPQKGRKMGPKNPRVPFFPCIPPPRPPPRLRHPLGAILLQHIPGEKFQNFNGVAPAMGGGVRPAGQPATQPPSRPPSQPPNQPPLLCTCMFASPPLLSRPQDDVTDPWSVWYNFLPFKQGTSCIGMGVWVVCSCGNPDLVVQLHNHQHNCRCIVLFTCRGMKSWGRKCSLERCLGIYISIWMLHIWD